MTQGILADKKGLVVGLSNDRSIAWGIAQAAHAAGAQLVCTYVGEAMGKRAAPLAASIGAVALDCNVADDAAIHHTLVAIQAQLGQLDFIVHAVAFANKDELSGAYLNTTRAGFTQALDISCYSFTALAQHAVRLGLLAPGASLLTLTYHGAQQVIPNYNVMGVAKAALEASVRYLAHDLGPQGVRVNAISAGPIKTLAASGIGDFRQFLNYAEANAPLRRGVTTADVGRAAVALLSDLGSGITGEVVYVDGGLNIMGMGLNTPAAGPATATSAS